MILQDAIRKASQILDEERMAPTVGYVSADDSALGGGLAAFNAVALTSERGKHPRRVRENREGFQFKSTNFELLCALSDQIHDEDREALFATSRARISNSRSFRHKEGPVLEAGSWDRCSSEPPLVVEFLVRRTNKQLFISALSEADRSPGLTLLLMQLEEMIALNFTVFTEKEYERMSIAMATISERAERLDKETRPLPTVAANTFFRVRREVPVVCDSVQEECRKAAFLYVKGELSSGLNLQVNEDKPTVRTFLQKLGFTPLLIGSLDEAERLYRTATTPFDLKSSMSHLRSFLEGLHREACAAANKKFGGSVPSKWGDAHQYLRDHSILTIKEQQFVIHFYTLMSGSTVHPLIAEREYARLMRNISIEYGLLLLTKMDKLGLK